jgi:hypothetical protein
MRRAVSGIVDGRRGLESGRKEDRGRRREEQEMPGRGVPNRAIVDYQR